MYCCLRKNQKYNKSRSALIKSYTIIFKLIQRESSNIEVGHSSFTAGHLLLLQAKNATCPYEGKFMSTSCIEMSCYLKQLLINNNWLGVGGGGPFQSQNFSSFYAPTLREGAILQSPCLSARPFTLL